MQATTRRDFLATTALGAAGLAFGAATANAAVPMRIGMCDWSMGMRGDLGAFERAHLSGLDGIEASLNTEEDLTFLRNPELQARYKAEAYKWGIDIPSIAIGQLNRIPLKSEPIATLWLTDAIEVARNLGARNILMAFFGNGELFPDKKDEMERVTTLLKDLAPRAEDAGVVLGLENTISARDNMRIIDAVKSPALQVYYDMYNSSGNGFDEAEEIRFLGKEQICQIHFKNGNEYMDNDDTVDWPGVAKSLKAIRYEGWYILETRSPSKDVIADIKKNADILRKRFPMA
jgi:L-ribulose-5-phosphate 3-epimerase